MTHYIGASPIQDEKKNDETETKKNTHRKKARQ